MDPSNHPACARVTVQAKQWLLYARYRLSLADSGRSEYQDQLAREGVNSPFCYIQLLQPFIVFRQAVKLFLGSC